MQMSGLMSRASDSVIPFINVSAPFFPCFSVLHYSVLIRSHSLFLTLSCSLNPKSANADKNTSCFLLSISSFFFQTNLSRPRRSPWRQRERKADPAGVPGHLKKVDDGQTFHTTPPTPSRRLRTASVSTGGTDASALARSVVPLASIRFTGASGGGRLLDAFALPAVTLEEGL